MGTKKIKISLVPVQKGGPVDQWQITCLARRGSWVQVPPGPPETYEKISSKEANFAW